ncbi:MAG: S8 family serine peptidase, partial [Acidimicrobiales bacterium]
MAAVGGIATFPTLSIDSVGTGYELRATSGSLTAATSTSFAITVGTATRVAFGQQPTNTTAGAAVTPAVTVKILDAVGNLVPVNNPVALAIESGTGTAGATLTGGGAVAAVGGIATFAGLRVDSAGTGYQLRATSSGLTAATSTSFAINTGAANRLAFGQQPTTTTAGQTITPGVTVKILDSQGNLVSATDNVTLAIQSSTGTAGATLTGGGAVAAVGGIATFAGLAIDSAGSGYQLRATSGSLTAATSTSFAITAGAANKLVFGQQPTTTTAGQTITPAVTVKILDAVGNLVTSSANVSLAIEGGTGTAGATLT